SVPRAISTKMTLPSAIAIGPSGNFKPDAISRTDMGFLQEAYSYGGEGSHHVRREFNHPKEEQCSVRRYVLARRRGGPTASSASARSSAAPSAPSTCSSSDAQTSK